MRIETYWCHSFIPELIMPDGIAFDLGVYDGGFSRLVAPRCGKVIGFEPDPRWHSPSQLPHHVTIVPKAIFTRSGRRPFIINTEKCSSLHYSDTSPIYIDVETVTLRDALDLAPSGRIDLIKMDIEGEEVPLLLDAPDCLFERVAQLSVEFHDFIDASCVPQIIAAIERMNSLGFHAVRFSWHSYGDVLFVNTRFCPL